MSDDLDLVNLLRALAQDMMFGDEAMAAETCRLSADTIERLTAERDAARGSLAWAMDEIDALSIKATDGWAYPQGMAMASRVDQLDNYAAACAIRALTSNKSATVQRCSRLSCGLREMKTEPPLLPPLMVCDQADCDRSIRALATSKLE